MSRFLLPFKLYLILDQTQTNGRPLVDVVRSALSAGVPAIQFRAKGLSLKVQWESAFTIQEIARVYSIPLLVNDRIDICLALDAAGVHLPSTGLPIHVARKMLGHSKLIAASCHSLTEVQKAESEGADFAVLGPVYDTPTKRLLGHPIGIKTFGAIKKRTSLPLFAIGGVKQENVKVLFDAGADGVAMVSEILSAEDVFKKSADILREITHHPLFSSMG